MSERIAGLTFDEAVSAMGRKRAFKGCELRPIGSRSRSWSGEQILVPSGWGVFNLDGLLIGCINYRGYGSGRGTGRNGTEASQIDITVFAPYKITANSFWQLYAA